MNSSVFIELPHDVRTELWNHLLPSTEEAEQAAFVFAKWDPRPGGGMFHFVERFLVPPEGFAVQSEYYIELTDETRASAIKRAHDLQTSLVEIHSHRGPWAAEFSPSDLAGFADFVPHVWWRLKRKPYLAIVIANDSLDGIAWIDGPETPGRLTGVVTDGQVTRATGLSALSPHDHGI
jgi:hypothetical protein